jgi:hypothetical protein
VFLPAVPERAKRLTAVNGKDEFALDLATV